MNRDHQSISISWSIAEKLKTMNIPYKGRKLKAMAIPDTDRQLKIMKIPYKGKQLKTTSRPFPTKVGNFKQSPSLIKVGNSCTPKKGRKPVSVSHSNWHSKQKLQSK